jgi:hypothetical protein
MEDPERLPAPEAGDEPQIFKPEKVGGRWTFSRKDFLKLALAAAAGAMASHIPGVKDLLGRRVQLVAHATELAETSLQPGKLLTKVWHLKNNSDLAWGDNAVLNFGGTTTWQTTSSIPLPNLAPGETTTVRVSMVAPDRLDPRPFEAVIKAADEEFKVYLPVIHKAPEEELPCSCDSYIPCTCESYGLCGCESYVPCSCVYVAPCLCDYEVPCVCDYHFCPCDYEVPCLCDYEVPCLCDYDYPCLCDYDCGCVAYVPCSCDIYVPCSCDIYVPCGCVTYNPCGCVYYF